MAEVLNKRSDLVQASGIPTVPLASQMKYGELALNYASGAETMFIKNSNDDIVSFSNDNAIIGYVDNNLSNYYTKLLSGNAKIFSGTCSTAAGTVAKVVNCDQFTSEDLIKGALIFVTFSATNSGAVAGLTMNVNGTGEKPLRKIYAASTPANLTAVGELRANQTYLFSYDGTNWVCITLDYNSNSTYSVISDSELLTGTATTERTVSAARLKANYNIIGRTIKIGADTIDVPLNELSENYEMSSLESNITLEEGDTYEEAFGKLEKAILNNELVTSHALNNLDWNIQTLILDKELLQLDLIDNELVIANALNNLKLDITSLDTSKLDTINSSNKLSADLISNGTINKVYTDVEQSKLSGIESGAQINVIESLRVNNTQVVGYEKDRRISLPSTIFTIENLNVGSSAANTNLTIQTNQNSNARHTVTKIIASDDSGLEEEWAMSGDSAIPTVGLVKAKVDLKAPLASPALTGTPTAPTAEIRTNTTLIATTEFVQNNLSKIKANIILETLNLDGLPYDAQVEYLQSDGSQYINLGITPESTDIVTLKFQLVSSTAGIFFGSRYSDSSQKFTIGKSSGGNFFAALGTKGNTTLANYDTQEHVVTLNASTGYATIDGGSPINVGSFDSNTYNMGLFGCNTKGTFSYNAHVKIMSCTIGNRMDLIAVRKDGTGYMYDRISGNMLGAAVGTFTYGNDVVNQTRSVPEVKQIKLDDVNYNIKDETARNMLSDLSTVATSGSYTDLVDAPQYVICTLTEYNAMASHDANTYYIIIGENNA